MFKIKDDYFLSIVCPDFKSTGNCSILNCIFSHDLDHPKKKRRLESDSNKDTEHQVSVIKDAAKIKKPDIIDNLKADKQIFSQKVLKKDIPFAIPKSISNCAISRQVRTINLRRILQTFHDKKSPAANTDAVEKEFEIASLCKESKTYIEKVDQFVTPSSSKLQHDPRYILPKELVSASPATIGDRKKYIKIFSEIIQKVKPELKTPVLEAIEEEFKIASSTSSVTYPQAIRRRAHQLKKSDLKKTMIDTISDEAMFSKLKDLVLSKETLIKYGYIMEMPENLVPKSTRTCRRCKNEFELDTQLKISSCFYHPGKVLKKENKVRVYDCCGLEVSESQPCERSDHHVFYWDNPGEMHHAINFQETSILFGTNTDTFKALGIDCEMGFTTMGFELLRITAVDFFTGEEVIDILTKPKGDVIDLNTKWSGISCIAEEAVSFEDSIVLLGEVMDQNTILIGHGLENDLNAMRLLHQNIVDTAILYPKYKTSPTFRYSLKYLTFQYLGRRIQTGEHDSKEDSIAAIDVVKYFIQKDLQQKIV